MNELKSENRNKPSSEEILKSLELCDSGYSSAYDCEMQVDECKKCIYNLLGSTCVLQAIHDALTIIREKNARIEELEAENRELHSNWHKLKETLDAVTEEDKRILAQKDAEIERLKADNVLLENGLEVALNNQKQIRDETITEFADTLKTRMREAYPADVYDSDIDEIANELKEIWELRHER